MIEVLSKLLTGLLKRKAYYLYLPVFFVAALPVQAQVKVETAEKTPSHSIASLHFEHLTVADGLLQGSVAAIHQDRRGFMWFGTGGGLSRYDGYTFKTYSMIPFDSSSFQGSMLYAIDEDSEGRLWIGTSATGLSRFDPATGRFERYLHAFDGDSTALTSGEIWDILISRTGMVSISGSHGLTRLDPETGDYTRFFHKAGDSASLSSNLLYTLHEDTSGALWIGSPNALNRLDTLNGLVTRYYFDTEEALSTGTVAMNAAIDIYAPPDVPHILWITGIGLIRFDMRTGTHQRYLPHPSEPLNRAHNGFDLIAPDPREANVLWLTNRNHLVRFDMRTGEFTDYQHDRNNPNSLAANSTISIYTDRFGMVWVGTRGTGASRFDPYAGDMQHYHHVPDDTNSLSTSHTWSIFEDSADTLWVVTEDGLNRIDRASGEVTHYQHDPNNPASISMWADRVYEDRSGTIWVGTFENGLDKMNRHSGTFTHYRHDPQDSTSITAGTVAAILQDQEGILWIATNGSFNNGGLNRMDSEDGTFTNFTHIPGDSMSLINNNIGSLYEDRSGNLWVGGISVLYRMNRASGTFTNFRYDPDEPKHSPSAGPIVSIYERPAEPGVLWLGHIEGGLSRFDTQAGTFTHYTKENELPDNTIYGILEDGEGRLWMSTNRGLSRFDPETETFKNYGLESGLQALEFNYGAYFQASDGEMFFGGVNGVNAFYPDQLQGNTTPPQVAFTDFKLFNKSVESGLAVPLTEAEEIRLTHDQNSVTFEYVGLHYREPEENLYAYMLEGFDEEWIQAETRRMAQYTNLNPGDYTFKVKAANSDGIWSEPKELHLTILSPWWRTWWAYLCYGLVFISGVFGADRFQRQRLLRKEREEAQERELEQAKEIEQAYHKLEVSHKKLKATQNQLIQQEKLASLGQLTAGIAHEIKNPLNFVNNFSDLSVELVEEAREELSALSRQLSGKESKDVSQVNEALDILDNIETNLRKIYEHGSRADSIVKSMLEHSRGGSGKMEPTDFNALVKEFVNLTFHGMRASKKPINVDIEFDLDENIGEVPLIAEDFSRVIINLCNNAFDAMRDVETQNPASLPQGGKSEYKAKLTVRTKTINGNIVVEIEDNGPGIPEEIKDKIMQPFFTTKKGTEGTGLGLSITHDIIKAHGGELSIESNKDGSIFRIQINKN